MMAASIESFFIEEYERLKGENEALKKRVEELASTQEYGFFDLGMSTKAIMYEVKGYYEITGSSNGGLHKAGVSELREILEKPDEELIEFAKTVKTGWDKCALEAREKTFPFTVEFADFNGRKKYVYDNMDSRFDLHEVSDSPVLGTWCVTEAEQRLKEDAAEKFRAVIRERIEGLEAEAEESADE